MNIVKKIRIIPRPINPIYNHKNINLYKLHNDKSYIGVDEAGRGPLLGRVYVAAVYYEKPICVPTDIIIADSKILKPKEIALAADFIMSTATKYSVKYKTEQEIDKYNIYKATMQGMKEAINDIYKTEDKVETEEKCVTIEKKEGSEETPEESDSDETGGSSDEPVDITDGVDNVDISQMEILRLLNNYENLGDSGLMKLKNKMLELDKLVEFYKSDTKKTKK